MTFVYDIEVFNNFFSITYWSIDGNIKGSYYIYKEHNDLEEIMNLFYEKSNFWVGYNSTSFDDPIIQHLIDNAYNYEGMKTDVLTGRISDYAGKVIDNKYAKYIDVSFNRFDLMRVANLYKSLKLVAVNLKHDLIQDLPYPFWHNVEPDQVDEILEYNDNDVEITWSLYHELREEILLRQDLSVKYGQNLMNYPDSGIANRVLENDYQRHSGIPYHRFKDYNTKRDKVDFSECVHPKVSFKSKNLQTLLKEIKKGSADKSTKIEYHALVGGTRYDIKKGGIHSNMPSEVFESEEDLQIIDADARSYYPNIMINYGIKPKHLHGCFLPLVKQYTEDRLEAKAENDKVASKGLKIVINSIYGKMGNEHHFLYDLKALYQTTLNGQLFLLMLIERLELAGINVFYANTDGVTALVPKEKEDEYYQICEGWQKYTGFDLDYDKYKKCVIRDVNNYMWIPSDPDKDIKYKGFFDINRWKEVTKSFDKPIVPLSVYRYFTEGIPVEETIQNHEDILDFCMAQKPGSKFDIEFHSVVAGDKIVEECQRANRYFVGRGGGSLFKVDGSKYISMMAGEPVHLLNSVSEPDKDFYPVKDEYYIREAYKVIEQFNNKQADLFL